MSQANVEVVRRGLEHLDGAVFTLRDGKCIRMDYYGSKADAVKAVGLAE